MHVISCQKFLSIHQRFEIVVAAVPLLIGYAILPLCHNMNLINYNLICQLPPLMTLALFLLPSEQADKRSCTSTKHSKQWTKKSILILLLVEILQKKRVWRDRLADLQELHCCLIFTEESISARFNFLKLT